MRKTIVFLTVLAVAAPAMGGIVGWWKLDNNTLDALPLQNHGVLHDPLGRTTWVAGAPMGASPAGALQFDPGTGAADNPYISVDNTALGFDQAAGFTAMAWMNPGTYGWDTWSGYMHTIISGDGAEYNASDYWGLQRRAGTGRQMAFHVAGTRLTSDINLNLDTWYHVAGRYDAATGEVKMYIHLEDGTLWVEKTGSVAGVTTNTNDISIGRVNPQPHTYGQMTADPNKDAQGFWRGIIDDVQLYDRPLSLSQIQVAMVPEPASLLLLASSVLFLHRRRS